MARRTAETPKIVFPVPLPKLFATLVEWDGPFTTDEVSGEFNTSDDFSTPALGALWDAELIDNNDGQWTVAVTVTPESAEAVAKEALYGAVTVEEAPVKPTTPVQRFKARKVVPAPAVEPIKGSDGKNVTVPVEKRNKDGYARETGERRELDASKGERVISEDNMRDVIKSLRTESEKTVTEITGSWVNEGEPTHFVEYDPNNVTGHMMLPEPEFIDAPPVGVHPNVWELSRSAATLPGRLFWSRKVREQMDAYAEMLKAEEAAKAEETPAPVSNWTPPIDPVTGEPFPF